MQLPLRWKKNILLINLGGGVVSDIGGFVAAIYKRGVSYINIPTSLLAMVDASIGSKTGIDFNNYYEQSFIKDGKFNGI